MQCGQALADLGELEAAEAVLSRGAEAATGHGLPTLCFEQRGRGPLHQDCAELLFSLLLDRLRASLRLRQQVGAQCRVPRGPALGRDRASVALVAARLAALALHSLVTPELQASTCE